MPELPFTVVSIAVGRKYNSWAVSMIETLRSRGKFDGPVHIITDQPRYYRRLAGVTATRVPAEMNVLQIKALKTLLFDYVKGDLLLYLDVDVLVGYPLELWYQTVKDRLSTYPIAMFRDNGLYPFPYHTGVMLLTRKAAELLKPWREALESGTFQKDQPAFAATMSDKNIEIMPDEYILFPKAEDMQNETVRTFVHITFTGRQRIIALGTIRSYLMHTFHVKSLPMNCRILSIGTQFIRTKLKQIWPGD